MLNTSSLVSFPRFPILAMDQSRHSIELDKNSKVEFS
jgi:hypothetical protein